MAFEISLMIAGQPNKFVRNGEPGLRDTTNALKVQQQQLRMYSKDGGPSNADFDANEANLANFAVEFWQGQFNHKQVTEGSVRSLKSLDSINEAVEASLDTGEEADDKPAKKSPTRTSKKHSTTSMTSTKPGLQTATN